METAQLKILGLVALDEKIFICYHSANNAPNEFSIDYSHDAKNFFHLTSDAFIEIDGKKETIANVSSFRFAKTQDIYHLFYLSEASGKKYLNRATSFDFTVWKNSGRLFPITSTAVQLPYFNHKGQQVIFFGDKALSVGYSDDGQNWNINELTVPQKDYLVGCVKNDGDGPHLIYFLNEKHEGHNHYSVWSVLLDGEDPTKILWKTDHAIWHQPQEWINMGVTPVGIEELGGVLYSYWELPGKNIYCVEHSELQKYADAKSGLPHAKFIRVTDNPILSPRDDKAWESKQVFNAAAIYHKGAVHLLYRAIGEGDTSVLGYAVSHDGINIDKRSPRPAYIPRAHFEHPSYGKRLKFSRFESGGGGYGGIEDPRLTEIDGKFYLTYVAYDGKNPPRVALSYITVKNFEKQNWNAWSDPVLISPPGTVDKNACILPEKVNGKYIVFHRIYPDILVDAVDSLEDFDGKSIWLEGKYKIHPRPDFWDSNKIGMGPPPIKTKDGWLAIYQAVGFQDNGRYKIGAMLLDTEDPSKVLYRSTHPLLEPETIYENGGFKSGVVYPCGAVVIDGTLIVYYGGSDTYLAAATANLDQFLDELKFDNSPHLDPVTMGNIKELHAET